MPSSRTNSGTTSALPAAAACSAGLSCTRRSRVNSTTEVPVRSLIPPVYRGPGGLASRRPAVASLQVVELLVLHPEQERVPFRAGEEQYRAVRILGVTQGDPAADHRRRLD